MILDFQNWDLEKCKELIAEYQQNKTEDKRNILLARFDKFILYIMYDLRRKYPYLKDEKLQDLYHTCVIGFFKGIDKFKTHLNIDFMIMVLKAYIKAELKRTYSYKNIEVSYISSTITKDIQPDLVDLNTWLIKEYVFTNPEFTDKEKDLINSKFIEDIRIEAIAEKYGKSKFTMYKQIVKTVDKLRNILKKKGMI